jgi:RNA polymerase sigma factor (sigma-70 family)
MMKVHEKVIELHANTWPALRKWLYTAAKNRAVDYLRRRGAVNRDAMENPEDLIRLDAPAADEIPALQNINEKVHSSAVDQEDEADYSEKLKALYSLKEEERDILFLRISLEMPFKEISKLKKLSAAACKMRFHRTMKTLRAASKKEKKRERRRNS